MDGLYVVGSSVFPTAGHANPTQMIVALAIRAADMLKARHFTVCTNAIMYLASWLTECPLPVLVDA